MLKDKFSFQSKIDVYDEIRKWKSDHPCYRLYVWGVGSLAAGVAKKLKSEQIDVDGYFVNTDNYHLDPRLSGVKVMLFDEILDKEEKIGVIVGHSHYELLKEIRENGKVDSAWALSSVVRSDISIDEKFVWDNIDSMEYTYSKLSDNISREHMVEYLNTQVTENCDWIINKFENECGYFENDIICLGEDEVYIDLGAYNGKSVDDFLQCVGHKYEQIVAVDVVLEMCEEMTHKPWAEDERVSILNTGISDHVGQDRFVFDSQSTCLSKDKGILLDVTTVDEICKGLSKVTLMKICIGNTVVPLLKGATDTIQKHLPKLVIAAGIDVRALVDYIPLIEEIAGKEKYEFYLRFTNASEESLILIAKPKN